MKQRKVYFKNNLKQKLVGVLCVPKGKVKFPAVIVCHGFSGNKNESTPIAEYLCKKGFITLIFDFHGHGESGGKLENITVTQELKDLKHAVDFIYKLKEFDKKRLGVIGHSLGGKVALLSAVKDNRIRSLVTTGAPVEFKVLKHYANLDLKKWKREGIIKIWGNKLRYQYYKDRASYDVLKEVKNLHRPLLIIHGNKDEAVPLNQARKLYENANEPAKLEIIKGAGHDFDKKHEEKKVSDLCYKWFRNYLSKDKRSVSCIIKYKNKYLILKRSKGLFNHGGEWYVIGGHKEKREDPLKIAYKEIEEETGLKKKRLRLLKRKKPIKFYDRDADINWKSYLFLFESKTKKIKLDWEHTDYRWIKLKDLKRYKIVYYLPRIMERVLK